MCSKLSDEDVESIRKTLVLAKFALEQNDGGTEKKEALKKINGTLDMLRKV